MTENIPYKLEIRKAINEDLESIVSILNEAVVSKFTTGFLTKIKTEERKKWFEDHKQKEFPVYIACSNHEIYGWISVSPYRAGRMAFRFTKEISFYVAEKYFRKGVATHLFQHTIDQAEKLHVKTFLAMVQEKNIKSIRLLEKFNFIRYGHLPQIADFNGFETGLFYYGLRIQ